MYYARSDTHYLLYIYDNVRNDLVAASDRSKPEKDLIALALQDSRELSLSRNENPGFDEVTGEGSRGWYNFVLKNSHLAFNSEQFAVFRALWKWRDVVAREEDESPHFVLGTSNVTEIARVNPPDAKALHSLLPLTAPLARSRLNEIWSQLQAAKAQNGPSLLHFFASQAPESTQPKHTISRIVKAQAKIPDIEGEVQASRLQRSQLFGDMPISSRWEESKQESDAQDDRFPFPWQQFVEEGLEIGITYEQTDEITAAEEPVTEAPPAAETPTEILQELDEEFTLKTGRKRKSEALEEKEESPESSEEDSDADSDEEMQGGANGVISIEDGAPQASKKAAKRERQRESKNKKRQMKEERAMRREAKLAGKKQEKEKRKLKADEQKKYEAVPFDYTKAASVLHTKRGVADGATQKEKKVFDPYSKTGDEPLKGARRAPPVKGERSATFRK